MNKQELKDARKLAFAVGFGLLMGKKLANFVAACIDRSLEMAIKQLSEDGNETCQRICNVAGIDCEKEPECKMGFHIV